MSTQVRGQNLPCSIAGHIGIAIITSAYSKENPIPIEAKLCRKYAVNPGSRRHLHHPAGAFRDCTHCT